MKSRRDFKGSLGVIDVGAHSVRLEIVQFNKKGEIEVLEDLSHTVPLGRDVFHKGAIQPENIIFTANVLRDFASKMREYEVVFHKAVATSAVREATNRDIFLNAVKLESGIDLEVLESSEEIRILYLSTKNILKGIIDLSGKSALICFIGTGSTHICVVHDGKLHSIGSLRLGTMRIFEEIGQSFSLKKSIGIVDTVVERIVESVVINHFEGKKPDLFIAAGAAVRTLTMLGGFDIRKNIVSIPVQKIDEVIDKITKNSPEELAEKYGISDINAQSISPCCEILHNFIGSTCAHKLIVPMINTRDAIIDECMRQINNDRDPFVADIISVATAIGQKYKYLESHAESVRHNSLKIFDALKAIHRIGGRGQLMLEVAAILHDIGQFVNARQHHKHSCYLIAHSQIPGISPEELSVIAAIARYHRRGNPKTSHPEYMCLSPENRVLVSALAGILRIADALDHAHSSKLSDFSVSYDDKTVTISTKGSYDLTIEQIELKKRSDLFYSVFSRKVIIQ